MNIKKNRKLVCLVFVFVMVFNTFTALATNIGNYVTDPNTTNDNTKSNIYQNVGYLTEKLGNNYIGIRGYYYNLGLYLSYGTWMVFLDTVKKQDNIKQYGLSDQEINDYVSGFNEFVKNFNARMKSDEELKLKNINPVLLVELDLNNRSKFNDCYNKTISESFKNYLDRIKDFPSNKSASDYKSKLESFNKKYKTELKSVYESVSLLYSSYSDIENSSPKQVNSANGNVSLLVNFDFAHSNLNMLWYKDLFLKEPYKTLMNHGKILFDEATEGLYKITNGVGEAQKVFYNDSTGKFESAYYAVIAGSSVYQPFKDKVGNESFKKALNSLLDDNSNVKVSEENKALILKSYGNLKDYKKPLYRRPWDGEKAIENSVATPVSCKDFFNSILSASSAGGALVHITKPFYLGKDTNSTGYFEEGDIVNESLKPNSNTDNNTNNNDNQSSQQETNDTNQQAQPQPQAFNKNSSWLDFFCKTVYAEEINPNQDNNKQNSDNNNKDTTVKSKGNKSDNIVHGCDEPISNNDIISQPVFLYGSQEASMTNLFEHVEMGNVIINNILKDNPGSKNIVNSNALLYINPFGDIVLSDNTVIVPASANPYLFNNSNGYYIGTKAFMQSYPSLLSNKDGNKFEVSNSRDVGKYLLTSYLDSSYDIIGNNINKLNKIRDYSIAATRITSSNSVDHSFKTTMSIISVTKDSIGEKDNAGNIMDLKKFEFSGILSNISGDQSSSYFLRNTVNYNDKINSKLFSIYDDKEQEKMDKIIIRNFYWYLTTNAQGISDGPNSRIHDGNLHSIFTSACSGTKRTEAFEKNRIIDSEIIAQSGFGRIKKTFADFSKDIFNFYGDSKGLLGLIDGSQDSVFSFILYVLEKYIIYILALIFIFLIFRYMKQVTSMAYMVFSAVIVVGFYYVALTVLPYYIPSIYNFTINSTTSDITNNIMALKSEQYKDVVLSKYDKAGRPLDNTCSINLYKCNKEQVKEICETFSVDYDEHLKGKVINIDTNNGLFLEGYNIKCSIDKLFSNIPILGNNNDIEGIAYNYSIKSTKINSSCIDYYTPYNCVVDEFIKNLNNFAKCMLLERKPLNYPQRGLVKDSFVVDSYMRSSIVLNPGDFSYEESYLDIDCCEALKDYFGEDFDWLGIRRVINNPSPELKSSLWYKTLESNGYLENTDKSKDSLDNLIEYVNKHTRLMLFDLGEAVNFMSDENLIKIISLNATMLLNQKASDYNQYMYPISLNTEELNFKDIAIAMFSDDKEAFMIQNNHPVDQVISKYGLFSLLIFDIASVESFLISRIIQYFIIFLYVAFLILLFIRFTTDSEMIPLIRGYLKCSIITFVLYLIFMVTMNFTYKLNDTAFCLWFMFIIMTFILKFILTTIWNVLSDLTTLGDTTVKLDPKSIITSMGITSLPFINKLNVGNFNSSRFIKHKNIDSYVSNSDYDKYRYDSYSDTNSQYNYNDNEGYFYDPRYSDDYDIEDDLYDNEDSFR